VGLPIQVAAVAAQVQSELPESAMAQQETAVRELLTLLAALALLMPEAVAVRLTTEEVRELAERVARAAGEMAQQVHLLQMERQARTELQILAVAAARVQTLEQVDQAAAVLSSSKYLTPTPQHSPVA